MGEIRKLTYGLHEEEIDPEQQAEIDRQTASLAGLALTLALIVLGLFLVHELQAKSRLEDCLLSGRTNCPVAVLQP